MHADRGTEPAIVVGTDGSASAAEAVRRAAQIAFTRGASLHIVHGFPRANRTEQMYERRRFAKELGYAQMGSFEIDGFGDPATIARAILEDAAQALEGLGVRVFLHPINAAPHRALRMVAAAKDAQMIVVGNKPQRAIARLMLRKPVAEAIREDAPCPVEVVDTRPYWNVRRTPARGVTVASATAG